MSKAGMKRFFARWPAIVGWTVLVSYIGWNAYWLAHGRMAPSMLVAATGIPSPTTGGTRALRAIAHGDWRKSVRYNAFAIPIALLFTLTVGKLVIQLVNRQKPRLSNRWLLAWIILLVIAWIAKLLGNSAY